MHLLDASDAMFPWHVWKSTITKKALRFPTSLFHRLLASFLLHFSFTVHSTAISCCSSALEFLQYSFPLLSLSLMMCSIQATHFIPARLSRLPPRPSCKKHQCVSQQQIWSSDRTEGMLHYFFKLTSACFSQDERCNTNTTRSLCF